jgi:hemerythrin
MNSPLFIVWQDVYNIDSPIINEQHRGIISTINSLHYFIQQGHELSFLKPTVDLAKMFMGFHFVTEKEILAKVHYPWLDDDAALQKQLFAQFKFICNDACLHRDPELLLNFLKHWWINHITEEHRKYSHHLSK